MKTFLSLALTIIICSCGGKNTTIKSDGAESFDLARNNILEVLNNQQASWNKGDIEGFMEGYWKSDSLSFIGARGVTNGWDQTLANYKKAYPDKKAMGRLQFEMIDLNRISNSAYQMIGKYTLYREDDQPNGYFTLLWKKIAGQWVIVSDQTCG